jgi:hypothetical protein
MMRVYKEYEEWDDKDGCWVPVVSVVHDDHWVDNLRLGSHYSWLHTIALALSKRRTKDAKVILAYVRSQIALQEATEERLLPRKKVKK